MEACIKFMYDDRYDGTKVRFFHSLWGYIFPAIYFIKEVQMDTTYWFESCGPHIDPVLEEIIQQLKINALIVEKDMFEAKEATPYVVPRWDVVLFRRITFSLDMLFSPYYTINLKHYVLRNMLMHILFPKRRKDWQKFKKEVLSFRAYMLEQFQIKENPAVSGSTGCLVIVRSVTPGEQMQEGIDRPHHAYLLRALRGVSEAVEQLNQTGIPAAAYEPGANTYRNQMTTYYNCNAVVAIRGSDLANLIWMQPGTKVVMIKPRHTSIWKKPTYHLFALAALLNFKPTELPTTVEAYPNLLDFDLVRFLK